MNLLRLLLLAAALPGRALIWGLNLLGGTPPGRPLPALERPLRWLVHVFAWLIVFVAFSMATAPPTPAPAAPVVRAVPRYVPPPVPTGVLLPTTAPSTPPSTPVDNDEPVYVPLPDDDDDDRDKPRICHRKWWC
jgi:hypothetical protein